MPSKLSNPLVVVDRCCGTLAAGAAACAGAGGLGAGGEGWLLLKPTTGGWLAAEGGMN